MDFYIYPQLKGLGIHYSRVHIRRKEKNGTFPLHAKLDETGKRIGWEKSLIDKLLEKRAAIARANAKVARAEWKRRAKARQLECGDR